MKTVSIKKEASIHFAAILFTPFKIRKSTFLIQIIRFFRQIFQNKQLLLLYTLISGLWVSALLVLVTQTFTEGLILYLVLLVAVGALLFLIASTKLRQHYRNFAVDRSHKKPTEYLDTTHLGLKEASHIQQAMLPSKQRMQQILSDHFVFFRPRDVVSGDFYWIEKVQEKIFLVVGDCTGHGVPGALMTMLCNQALENIIMQRQISAPEQILKQLDITLRKTLHTEQTHVRNGLDAVVCVIETQQRTLRFAGARSHLVIVQNNDFQLIKGDVYSINGHRKNNQKNLSFSAQQFALMHPTTIYLFSDGIQDQFGGCETEEPFTGHKFSRNRLLRLLENIQAKPLEAQKALIAQAVDEWQGTQPQIDDMLLVGARF